MPKVIDFHRLRDIPRNRQQHDPGSVLRHP